jgi:uncharacterized protein (DUF1778 family)
VTESKAGETRDKRSDVPVADSTFELDEPNGKRLVELIDRPAVVPPGLRSLFSKPSVFE